MDLCASYLNHRTETIQFFFFHFCTNGNFYHISASIIFISNEHFRENRFFAQSNALNWQTLGNMRLITTALRHSGAS